MTGKIRVYELARELGMDTKALMKVLKDMGIGVKTASSSLSDEDAGKVREVLAPHRAHQEQLKKEAEAVARAREEAEKARKEAPVVARPIRVMRIARVATAEERAALMERQERKTRGEEILESATEVKKATAEAAALREERSVDAPVPAPVPEPIPPPVAEPLSQPAPSETLPPPAEVAPGQPEPAMASVSAEEARRLTPEQMIAHEYRDVRPPAAVGATAGSLAAPPAVPAQAQTQAGVAATVMDRRPPSGPPPGPARAPGFRPGAPAPPRTQEILPSNRPGGPRRPGQQRPGPGPRQAGGPRSRGGKGPRPGQSRPVPGPTKKEVELPEMIAVGELASRLEVPASELIKYLIKQGQMVTINQALDYEQAANIARVYGFEVTEASDEDVAISLFEEENAEQLEIRPPVVTVLGHVDHGKTSLLDAIRETEVTATEAGGITQKIGAYTVHHNDRVITFIDTPGHEAFTQMRARGARVTDIAILVVAADDGVMPQTVEAINHARAAKVPIIVALNKVDKPQANPDKVMQQLTEYNLVAEAWGGDTICIPVSAKKRTGIQELLEMVLLVADMQELRANPSRKGQGTIIEATVDKGLGPVATVLVQNGTLRVGDTVVVGNTWGRVRGLLNEHMERIRRAGPAIPAEIVGLTDLPNAGDFLQVVDDEKMAKQVSEARTAKSRHERIHAGSRTTLEDLFSGIQAGEVKELKLLVKAEGGGSVEALRASLEKLSTDEVRLNIVHAAVGSISESDVMLASASDAIIIGFNVRPDSAVKRLADQEGVDVRLYRVIYHVLEDIKKAMTGLLSPDVEEVELGRVEIRQIFKISKVGKVAGCYVQEGKITRDAEVRLLRDGVVLYVGKLESLKRFKEDVKEVGEGYECGLSVLNYPDLQEGDILEAFKKEFRERESL